MIEVLKSANRNLGRKVRNEEIEDKLAPIVQLIEGGFIDPKIACEQYFGEEVDRLKDYLPNEKARVL